MRQYESCEEACRERRLELVNGGDYDELTAAAAAAQQARNLIMDLSEQAHQVKFMIRGRGLTSPPPRRGLRRGGDPDRALQRRYAPHERVAERWIGGWRCELLDRTLIWNQAHLRRILSRYETRHNQHRPHRSLAAAAPLKPLPEPADLDQYRVRNTLASVV